jgi:hypothetical protein
VRLHGQAVRLLPLFFLNYERKENPMQHLNSALFPAEDRSVPQTSDATGGQPHGFGATGKAIACTVAWQEEMPGVQAVLFPYCPPTTPVQFYILAVARPGGVEYTPGALVGAREQG